MLVRKSYANPELETIYQRGLFDEKRVIEWLGRKHDVRASTPIENIRYDIDCYLDGESVSIKCNEPKYNNFCFELEAYSASSGGWVNSWYNTGTAKYYIIWKKATRGQGRIFVIEKDKLVKYVKQHGWDRQARLTKSVAAVQKHHDRQNAHLGLIDIDKCVDLGLAAVIGFM